MRKYYLCIAIEEENKVGILHMNSFVPDGATSGSMFGESLNCKLQPSLAKIKQGSISLNLNSFLANSTIEFPTYIKIDVDGLEHKIINGALDILKDERIKSVLIELDTGLKEHRECINKILQWLSR